jgi:hypothetical protein
VAAPKMLLAEVAEKVPPELQRACLLANKNAYAERRPSRANCVLAAHALAAFLRVQGQKPTLVRIEAHAFPATGYGVILGSAGDGTRRPAASPGCWHGHLGVTCGGHLLDPTLDQVNDTHHNMSLPPVVLPLPPMWDDEPDWRDPEWTVAMGREWHQKSTVQFRDSQGTTGYYAKYHRQVGWKSAGDARPSHWLPIVHAMVSDERGTL